MAPSEDGGGAVVRVKICGIRRPEDGRMAACCGADAVGVLVGQVHPSDDFVAAPQAAAIFRALPPFVTGVLVSHLVDPGALAALAAATGARTVQVHGAMEPEGLVALRRLLPGVSILRALHGEGPEVWPLARALAPCIDAFVADSANPRTGQVGGTGLVHDWHLSAQIRAWSPVPLVLAGGLTANNVGAAIARVRPYAVDVNSGVKGADGYKDASRLRAFIAAAKGCGAPQVFSRAEAG